MIHRELIHNPIDHMRQGLGFHRTTGFANGRQRPPSPVLRTTLLQRAHEETIRCTDEINVAGLPLAAAHLTVPQPQLLLAVPMKGLGASPAMPIHQHYTNHFPPQTITHQGFTRVLVVSLTPKQNDPHGMPDVRDPHLLAEIPILPGPYAYGFLRCPGNLPRHVLELLLLPPIHDLAVELQVANIGPLFTLEMIQHFRAREVTIEGKIPWNLPLHRIIDQLDTQLGVVFK